MYQYTLYINPKWYMIPPVGYNSSGYHRYASRLTNVACTRYNTSMRTLTFCGTACVY